MIDRQEIMEFAREFGLTPQVIEKDYVLGWMLAGIAVHQAIGPSWVFKGGTCLKKCYFETYRFSEDLDFTLTEPAHLDERFLLTTFGEIAEWIYEQTGIEVPRDTIGFEFYDNPRGHRAAQGRVGYRGPMRRGGDAPRIKLDLTDDEVVVLEPIVREVHHPYSDRPREGIGIQCYSFEEVFAEKIRAMAERERPRDLYDVVHLYRHDELRPDRALVFSTLQRKCAFKGIDVPTMTAIESQPARAELEADWSSMLAHQLPALPPFEQFWREMPALFDWLHGAAEKVARPRLRLAAGGAATDETWHPPAMGVAWHVRAPLESIRFAAANHLCVSLEYQDERGRVGKRLIEPYSLRRTQEGNILLYAVKVESGESRSYRIDRMTGAEVTKIPFTPRFQVELTPVGAISAPTAARTRTSASVRPTRTRGATHRPSRSSLPPGPKYVFRCTVCRKLFYKKTHDASLNAHKNKRGTPCPGRAGFFVRVKYR